MSCSTSAKEDLWHGKHYLREWYQFFTALLKKRLFALNFKEEYMRSKMFKRITSSVIVAAMMLSLNTWTMASAENDYSNWDYYQSIDPNGEEYQEWKSYISLYSTTKAGMLKSASRAISNGITNDYVSLTINGSRFTLGTTGGNPDTAKDDNQKLLFGYPNGGTSYTTIQIDGTNYIFTPDTTTYRDNSVISTFKVNDVVISQYLNIIDNKYTDRDDVAEFLYVVENTGASSHEVGVRIMFDTMLGTNDSAPFRIPEIGDVTTETDLRSEDVPEFWQAFDSLTDPSVIAQGTLKIDKESTPDRVRFTNWGMASNNQWDFVRSAGSVNGDSAVCLYWNPQVLEADQIMSCKTYYGLSSLQQDNAPPLAVAMSGATKLDIIDDENGNQSYSPNPFTVTAYIQNIGTGTAYNTNIELVLPEDMSVVDGYNTIPLGDLPVSNKQKQVSWKVNVEPSSIDKIEKYGIIVTADNADTKTLEREIEIPAIDNNDLVLMLDRSTIVDGNNLNLKFKIINNGVTPIPLNQIVSRYYFIDESPKTEKQFNCYSVQTNNPYLYLPSESLIVEKHDLDVLRNGATSYYEFSFNTNESIEPKQEIIVNIGINNYSWSKMVASNDFSALGDDTYPESGYVDWEYMPIFSTGDLINPIWGIIPELNTEGLDPDLLVELDPNVVNNQNYMNLNIRLTNNGLVPIDLGQTEIKYYYTNDDGFEKSVSGHYVGGKINDTYISITDKAVIESIRMDVRKKNADTYVSVKFAEDTGVLYFEDYIDLNVQVYNTNWETGEFILENDHSYLNDEPKLRSFRAKARNLTNSSSGMRTAHNIIVSTMAVCLFPPIPTNIIELTPIEVGYPPMDYEPTYSAFKIGWSSNADGSDYTNDDYEAFISGMSEHYNANAFSNYATASNLNEDIDFTQKNMDSILKSDISYISGHGYFGGVIPVFSNGFRSILVANNSITDSQFHRHYEKEDWSDTVFNKKYSFKDGENTNIKKSNLQWLIFGACSQLNDFEYEKDRRYEDSVTYDEDGKYTYEYWLNTLLSNKKMKGMLGYWWDAPIASFKRSDKDVIKIFLEKAQNESIYSAWMKANAFTTFSWKPPFIFDDSLRAAIMVKDDYANQTLYTSLCDSSDINCKCVYLYKARFIEAGKPVEYHNHIVYMSNAHQFIFNALSEYLQSENIVLSKNLIPVINEFSRTSFTGNGEYIKDEIMEYTISFVENSDDEECDETLVKTNVLSTQNNKIISENSLNSREISDVYTESAVIVAFSYNPQSGEVSQI